MANAEDVLAESLDVFVPFVRRRVGDPELAADLVQDSLLKALQSNRKPLKGVTLSTLNVRLYRPRRSLRRKLEAVRRVCAVHGCLDCSCDVGEW